MVEWGHVEALVSPAWIRSLCDRRRGIGADGLIAMQASKSADLRMRYFNADGSEANMCGNGLRCLLMFSGRDEARIETGAGVLTAVRVGDRVRAEMGACQELFWGKQVERRDFDGLDTGVPHVVAQVDDLEAIDVDTVGPLFVRHPAFPKEGVNVNFVQKRDILHLRTFERGVEAETLACGTGACAAVYSELKGQDGTLEVEVRSGDRLKIGLKEGVLTMEGPAKRIFTGNIELSPGKERLYVS